MEETAPARRPRGQAAWPPSGWSLRVKITVVLLVPVIVALTLAGLRIDSELAEASTFSAVRDQLPVLQDLADLSDLIDQEMVATAAGRGSAPTSQVDATDAKVSDLQRAADFANLPADMQRALSGATGRLGGLRTTNAGSTPIGTTQGYRDIVFALANTVPGITSTTGNGDLDRLAFTVRNLLQMRANLAVQEALLRSMQAAGSEQDVIAAAAQAAAAESALHDQVTSAITGPLLARFNSATVSLVDRQAVLQTALSTERSTELAGLLLPIATESAGVGDVITDMTTTLTNDISAETDSARSTALRDTALVIGALLGALAIALAMARSLLSPMRRLHSAALTAAHRQLPDTIERVRNGEEVSWQEVEPVGIETGEEIGQLANAFDDMHRSAVRLAGEQAVLRKQVSEMFMTLARRSQSMVETQLTVLEDLESNEHDPQRLDELFRLDHLATRLRRNGENLQVLAGGTPSRADTGPVSMVELLRGATSEVKDYKRITLVNVPNGMVRSPAASDVVHILAELLENATRFSPPEEKVFLTADRGVDGGLLVEVVDRGLGMTPGDLDLANHRLASGDTVSPETARRMGLFVVGRLAGMHGVTVRLRPTHTRGGVTASVHLPGSLIIAEGAPLDEPAAVGSGANGLGHNGSAPNGTSLAGLPANGFPVSGAPVNGHRLDGAPVNGVAGGGARNGFGFGGFTPPQRDYTEPTEFADFPGARGEHTPSIPEMRPEAQNPGTDEAVGLKGTLGGGPSLPMRVPKSRQQQQPGRTPIFERVVSNWFTEHEPDPQAETAPPSANWVTPADEARRKAERAVQQPAATVVSAAGLPTRKPGAQLAPGAALPRRTTPGNQQPAGFRDPAAVRNNLSRHYNGMRAARQQRTADEEKS